jgi:hypothetical protein
MRERRSNSAYLRDRVRRVHAHVVVVARLQPVSHDVRAIGDISAPAVSAAFSSRVVLCNTMCNT